MYDSGYININNEDFPLNHGLLRHEPSFRDSPIFYFFCVFAAVLGTFFLIAMCSFLRRRRKPERDQINVVYNPSGRCGQQEAIISEQPHVINNPTFQSHDEIRQEDGTTTEGALLPALPPSYFEATGQSSTETVSAPPLQLESHIQRPYEKAAFSEVAYDYSSNCYNPDTTDQRMTKNTEVLYTDIQCKKSSYFVDLCDSKRKSHKKSHYSRRHHSPDNHNRHHGHHNIHHDGHHSSHGYHNTHHDGHHSSHGHH